MLVDLRDSVWVEEPGYWDFHTLLLMDGVRARPLCIEAVEGGPQAGWPRGGKPPKLIFVIPSYQVPLGSAMSLARQRELPDRRGRLRQ